VDEEPPHRLLGWRKTSHLVVEEGYCSAIRGRGQMVTSIVSPLPRFSMKQLQLEYQEAQTTPLLLLLLVAMAGQDKERSDGDDALETSTLIEGARIDLVLQPPP
jgi:hypothetical protein